MSKLFIKIDSTDIDAAEKALAGFSQSQREAMKSLRFKRFLLTAHPNLWLAPEMRKNGPLSGATHR